MELVVDGVYFGVYTVREMFQIDDERIDIVPVSAVDLGGRLVTGGYVLRTGADASPYDEAFGGGTRAASQAGRRFDTLAAGSRALGSTNSDIEWQVLTPYGSLDPHQRTYLITLLEGLEQFTGALGVQADLGDIVRLLRLVDRAD